MKSPTHESTNKNPRHIEKIGLKAEATESSPNIETGLRLLGSGFEGDTYEYRARDGSIKAIKVFRPRGKVWDDNYHQEFDAADPNDPRELSKTIFRAAHTARWADRIQHPAHLIEEINKLDDELMATGSSAYNIRTLQESFARVGDLNTNGFRNYLTQRALALGQRIFVPEINIDPNFKGGLGSAINRLVEWTSTNYPQLQLPKRIFPRFIQFGKFPEDYPNLKVAGREYLVMEKVHLILGDYIEKTQSKILSMGSILSDSPEIAQVQPLPISIQQIAGTRTNLEILASLGLTFGDLKLGNIAFDADNTPILIDPTAVLKTGSIQDIATMDYLPPHVQAQVRMMQPIKGDPQNDIYALNRILSIIQQEWMQAVMQGLRKNTRNIMHDERVGTETASTMLQNSRRNQNTL
ncbi:hypothetical protein IT417_02865 [bacterium]|nr:hypothetical protein [bacterium]